MIRKDLEKLLRYLEPQITGLLTANGLIEKNAKKFSEIKLTQKGRSISGFSDPIITEEWLKEWKNMWPVNYRGTTSAIREKLNRFLMEHDVQLEEIISATEHWLMENKTPYHGSAQNFFYKKESGVEVSRCEEYLEIIKEKGESPDYDFIKLVNKDENT